MARRVRGLPILRQPHRRVRLSVSSFTACQKAGRVRPRPAGHAQTVRTLSACYSLSCVGMVPRSSFCLSLSSKSSLFPMKCRNGNRHPAGRTLIDAESHPQRDQIVRPARLERFAGVQTIDEMRLQAEMAFLVIEFRRLQNRFLPDPSAETTAIRPDVSYFSVPRSPSIASCSR